MGLYHLSPLGQGSPLPVAININWSRDSLDFLRAFLIFSDISDIYWLIRGHKATKDRLVYFWATLGRAEIDSLPLWLPLNSRMDFTFREWPDWIKWRTSWNGLIIAFPLITSIRFRKWKWQWPWSGSSTRAFVRLWWYSLDWRGCYIMWEGMGNQINHMIIPFEMRERERVEGRMRRRLSSRVRTCHPQWRRLKELWIDVILWRCLSASIFVDQDVTSCLVFLIRRTSLIS